MLKRRILACLMTSLRSATKSLPSADSFGEGDERGFEARTLFKATSICLFEGTLPLAKAE